MPMHLLSPCSRIVYHGNNVPLVCWTNVVLKGFISRLTYVRGCVTCRIISCVKIVKDTLKYICRRAFRSALYIYIYIYMWAYAYML